jgi:hypothetical protein
MPVAVAVAVSYVLNQFLLFTLLSLLLLLFPDGKFISPRWSSAFIGPLVLGVSAGLVTLLAAGPIRANADVAKPFGMERLVTVAETLTVVYFASFVLGIVFGAASLFRRYRSGGSVQRQQVKWVAASASLIVLFFVTLFVLLLVRNFFPDVLEERVVAPALQAANLVSALSLALAITVAVLRYRLYDIDVLINRALVYGVTTVAIAVAFFGGIVVVQAVLRPLTSGSELAVAASTLLSVALFQPLRRRIQDAVDRRFYRSRYDAARTLDDFSVRLRDQVSLNAVRSDLLDAVRDTVQPVHASVWLRPE